MKDRIICELAIETLTNERDEARAEAARLRAALDYYSSEELYRGHDPAVLLDVGYRARAALGEDS